MKSALKPRRIGYARVSTTDQSMSMQFDALKRAGVKPDDIYSDTWTGANMRRPGFQGALKALRGTDGGTPSGDQLVVWRLDRLGRSLVELVRLLEDLDKRGVGLVSLTDHIDTSTATGRLIFHLFASLAQFERELTVERTMAGLQSARAQGRVGGADRTFLPAQEKKIAREFQRKPKGKTWTAWRLEVAAKHGVSKGTIYNIDKRYPPEPQPKRKAKHGKR